MHSSQPSPSQPSLGTSRRTILLAGLAALTGGVAGVWRRAGGAQATRTAAAIAVPEIGAAAAATETAERVRLRPPGKLLFPMNPSPKCAVLDNFGESRSSGRAHQGCDILATEGQEVYAVVDGTLTDQVLDVESGASLSGNLWELTASDGSKTYYVYAHLSGFAPGLEVGSIVLQGDVIGYVGDTGNPGTGNYHLHFEVHPEGGSAVNPLPLLDVPAACSVW